MRSLKAIREEVDNEIKAKEREVIEYSKQGYKMTQIAVQLDCTRKKVENARNRAIDKILDYLCVDERLSV